MARLIRNAPAGINAYDMAYQLTIELAAAHEEMALGI
jgi:hypothetical protein